MDVLDETAVATVKKCAKERGDNRIIAARGG
jgi:hypothetical protein